LTKSRIQIHKDDDIYHTLKSFESSNSNQNNSNSNYVQSIFDPKHSDENTNSLKKKTQPTKKSQNRCIEKTKNYNGSSYFAKNISEVVSINSTPIKEENKGSMNNTVTVDFKNNDNNENISLIEDIPNNTYYIENIEEISEKTVKERYLSVSEGKSFLIDTYGGDNNLENNINVNKEDTNQNIENY
jgi:hypothetical protein